MVQKRIYVQKVCPFFGCSDLVGPLGEKRFWPLRERWFWVLFGMLVAVLIVPFLIVGLIVRLVPASNLFGVLIWILIVTVVIWLLLKGYRDWTEGKKKEQERKKRPENVLSFFASEFSFSLEVLKWKIPLKQSSTRIKYCFSLGLFAKI